MASATWAVQPEIENSRTNKLCAKCMNPAILVCSRCRCTIYCGKECQRKHWVSTHKAHCSVDPLFGLSKKLPLPKYREFSGKEKENNFAYTLLPGQLKGPETDQRDGLCRLIISTEPEFVERLNMLKAGLDVGEIERQIFTHMGWGSIGMEVVTGFSYEDTVIFRIYFDDNFQNRIDLAENSIAPILMNCSGKTRGKFVVTKYGIKNGDHVPETLIPFTKAELVDMMTWRVLCGRHQLLSSRMFRENMRRREVKDGLANMGFRTIGM